MLLESRYLHHRGGVVFEWIRCVLEVLDVEEVGGSGLDYNKNKNNNARKSTRANLSEHDNNWNYEVFCWPNQFVGEDNENRGAQTDH